MKSKKHRLNLEFSEEDFAELTKASSLLEASSLTEAIRRSIRITNKLLTTHKLEDKVLIIV